MSEKDTGIRYLIRAGIDEADLIKKSLMSYLPGVNISYVSDYLTNNNQLAQVTEFGLASHFVFPLKTHENLEKNDPIAYLTGSMTKLKDNELLAFQIVASPLKKSSKPDIKRVSSLIYSQKDLMSNIRENKSISTTIKLILSLFLQVLLLPIGIMVFVATDGKEGPLLQLPFNGKKNKTDNPYQLELEGLIKQKLDQPLSTASLRFLVHSNNKLGLRKKQRGFVSALSSMSNSSYQSLRPVLKLRFKLVRDLKRLLFKHRLIKPFGKTILSTSEMGDLYHFPFTKTTKTEDLQKQHSKELPTPVSLKKATNLDVIFAKNTYGGTTTAIGLIKDERRRHMYILGATGTGKSTMLLSMIDSDLKNNKGIAVLDPHGDLIEEILHIIPKERIKDVVYFNPDDIGYPMGINILELSEGLSEEDALREKEFVTESVISLFHKVYTEKYSGPRLEYILRNTIHTAFTVPGATLFTVNKLLINPKFRKSVVKKLTDENLREFWKYEFAKAGDYQKVKMILPITNKIGRFLFSPTAKRILEQEKSTIDFDEIMNKGKILLCNLSKGKIGEDNSKVFGAVMMAKLQLAALKRARIPMNKRKDFYLYVDEFQNFASESFAQILSEARKYKLNAVLAHQTTSQLEDKSLVNVTLANTGTVICFRTANPEDERLILPQFRPSVELGEIASLPSYRFYMRLGALNPEEPFSGETILIEIIEDKNRVDEIINSSRKQYAIKYVEKKEESLRVDLEKTEIKPKKTNRLTQSILP
ncbi:type IV secretion system DNA-binding domain-containing protein [Patescibacteria group bacterium]|nr:type IV secretion system DNA-binding domain-containing protein [Patescibacteria group bacterium]